MRWENALKRRLRVIEICIPKKQRLETPVDVRYYFDDGDYDCSPQLSMPTKSIILSAADDDEEEVVLIPAEDTVSEKHYHPSQ